MTSIAVETISFDLDYSPDIHEIADILVERRTGRLILPHATFPSTERTGTVTISMEVDSIRRPGRSIVGPEWQVSGTLARAIILDDGYALKEGSHVFLRIKKNGGGAYGSISK